MMKRTLKEITPLKTPYALFNEKEYLSFSTNDYLGLAHHPLVKEGAIQAIETYGTSSSSARTLAGSTPLHLQVEEKLATLTKKEASLLFNTGYLANHGVITTLANKNTTLLLDRKCHRSIIEGALASGAKVKRFHHNNMAHLEQLLKNSSGETWIITESIFSMDGDLAPLEALISLKETYGAILMVDEAHAIGVMGDNGGGLCQNLPVDIVVGILGKGVGSFGGFVATSQHIKEKLINFSPSFLFTTALPPPILGATNAALTLLPTLDKERAHIKALYTMLNGQSHIVPHILGSAEKANDLTTELRGRGILVFPIHPPTVPEGQSMLRFSLTANHTKEHIAFLKETTEHYRS